MPKKKFNKEQKKSRNETKEKKRKNIDSKNEIRKINFCNRIKKIYFISFFVPNIKNFKKLFFNLFKKHNKSLIL